MIMRRQFQLLSVFCLVFVVATSAQDNPSPQDYTGTWVMKFGQRPFVVLTLKNNNGNLTGTLTRPEHFGTSDGVHFSHIGPGVTKELIVSGSMQKGHLHFVTEDPKDRADKTEYDITLTGQDHASIKLADAPLEAWSFNRTRSKKPPAVSTDWDPQRSYAQEDSAVSSVEMQRIFKEDQKPRQDPGNISAQEWTIINQQDAERRSRTRKLLADGQLHQTGLEMAVGQLLRETWVVQLQDPVKNDGLFCRLQRVSVAAHSLLHEADSTVALGQA